NITPEQLLKLSAFNNIVAIKEASGNISQIAKMKSLCGDKIDIYSGNDDQIIPIMSLGGLGVISVAANIVPNVIHNLTSEFLHGNYDKALKLQLDYLELCNTLFIETNPIPIKTALNILSKDVGNLRLPLYKMDDKNEEKLVNTLKKYNLI
ncbi:dihydrodipicolinate synthase family protein, partial [Clostridium saudiense]|nr:dihydrodipicolinate synthase family protein [Clostridium saudiense]